MIAKRWRISIFTYKRLKSLNMCIFYLYLLVRWRKDLSTLRTPALAHSYLTGEYCAAVLEKSGHALKTDSELNNTCRVVTGSLRQKPLPSLYRLEAKKSQEKRRNSKART